jgi:hypothetical protein
MIFRKKISQALMFLVILGAISFTHHADAQQTNPNKLPVCPPIDNTKNGIDRIKHWTSCWGWLKVDLNTDMKEAVMQGEFKNGQLHGYGIVTGLNGDKYFGSFKNGDLTGFGHFSDKNGNTYSGLHKNGIPNGEGRQIIEGKQLEGIWENGKLIREQKITIPSDISGAVAKNWSEFGATNTQTQTPRTSENYLDCNPNIHPDNWLNCTIFGSQRGSFEKEGKFRDVILQRFQRAREIVGEGGGQNFLFRNGVLVATVFDSPPFTNCLPPHYQGSRTGTGRDNCQFIDKNKYDDAEQARLKGDFQRANDIERTWQVQNSTFEKEFKVRIQAKKILLKKQCVGKAEILPKTLEDFSNQLSVSPDQIFLNRLELRYESSCMGIFRHPRGTCSAEVRFNSSGQIDDIRSCDR